jgi:hypothetical protein
VRATQVLPKVPRGATTPDEIIRITIGLSQSDAAAPEAEEGISESRSSRPAWTT